MRAVWKGEIFKSRGGRRPWVARLTGLDARFGFRRDFLKGIRDYSFGKEHHTRGVYLYFFLPPGLYETQRPISWKYNERQFIRVDNQGEIHEISKDEVVRWLASGAPCTS